MVVEEKPLSLGGPPDAALRDRGGWIRRESAASSPTHWGQTVEIAVAIMPLLSRPSIVRTVCDE